MERGVGLFVDNPELYRPTTLRPIRWAVVCTDLHRVKHTFINTSGQSRLCGYLHIDPSPTPRPLTHNPRPSTHNPLDPQSLDSQPPRSTTTNKYVLSH